jgi:hypothetical protein
MKPIKESCLLCAGGIITYINVVKYVELADRDRMLSTLTDDDAWDSCLERTFCPYCIKCN